MLGPVSEVSGLLSAAGDSGLFGGGGVFGKSGGGSKAISGGPFYSGLFEVNRHEQYGFLIVAGIVLLFLISRR